MPTFAEFEAEKWKWVTAFDKKFYPDHFEEALSHYKPYIERFRALVLSASDSAHLLRLIQNEKMPDRIQILRIFNRYVSPVTSVEMLKKKSSTDDICQAFGPIFRAIELVKANIASRDHDDVLAALMFEHKERGQFGYELTERFFTWFDTAFAEGDFKALGPRRAGKDIELRDYIPTYREDCPTDILITYEGNPVVAGFARYDSDRGGSQEDDRTGGNNSKIMEIIKHSNRQGVPLKIFFLNDGPGLLLGSMWRDYANMEAINPSRILVASMKMLDSRLTRQWMLGAAEASRPTSQSLPPSAVSVARPRQGKGPGQS